MGLVEEKYSDILNMALEMGQTSSILNPLDESLTFARNDKYLRKLLNTRDKELALILPHTIDREMVIIYQRIFTHLS